MTKLEQMVAERGEAAVAAAAEKWFANMEYRRAYSKDKARRERAILQAYKSGKLTFGGSRVDMTAEEVEQ